MEVSIEIADKPVNILISAAASKALDKMSHPLLVEMELYFSCLIRKRVLFNMDGHNKNSVQVSDQLWVKFRPVMTQHCGTDYAGDEPPLVDFPLQETGAFVPKWLKLDYRKGDWRGEFGY